MAAARNPVIGQFRYPRDGLYRIGAHQDGRPAWLTRRGKADGFIQMKKLSMKGYGGAAPEPPDHLQPLNQSAAPLPFVDTECTELSITITLPNPEEHLAAGKMIQRRENAMQQHFRIGEGHPETIGAERPNLG